MFDNICACDLPHYLFLTDMHFALKSMGFLDLGKIALHKAFSYAAYDKDITRLAFGILVLVIDHSNGELYDNTFFNTHYHKEDSYKMINYIQRLPRNMIVLAAVHSDWIRSSTPQLQQVLVSESSSLLETFSSPF